MSQKRGRKGGFSFSAAVRKIVRSLFHVSERKDAKNVESYTAAEIWPKVRAAMRDTIKALANAGAMDSEAMRASMVADGASEEMLAQFDTIVEKVEAGQDLTDADASLLSKLVISQTTVSSALQQLSTDDAATDPEDGTPLKINGEVVRIPDTSVLVRDPWTDFTGRKGSTGFCLREEYDRAREARFDTFPDATISLEAAREAFERKYAAAQESGDRWVALSLFRHEAGGQYQPEEWLEKVAENDE